MMKENYNLEYKSKSLKVLFPSNIITKLFLSRFSPIKKNLKIKKF